MFVFLLLLAVGNAALPPSCDSRVYCTGPILHTVQMARVFNDSKTFVDLKMKYSENVIFKNFDALMSLTNNSPTRDQVAEFVSQNFEDSDELEPWHPPDFKSNPEILGKIQDSNLRKWAYDLNVMWKNLSRKVTQNVIQNPSQYSLMPLPNGFIIPGGRFKEIYYWDTYWIVRGLLISEMYDTARGMIENLMFLVKKLGHVPNGSRVYYTERSQPPLLTKMVVQYIKYTKDTSWLRKNIDVLEQELNYWIKNKQVKIRKHPIGISYKLYQYNAPSYGPRPESYYEDIQTAKFTVNRNLTYIELKSGAESGWDFSSRWIFDSNGSTHANLSHIHTTRIIPVDLNAYVYDAFKSLSELYFSVGKLVKGAAWRHRAATLEIAINNVLWNDENGVWLDYDIELKKHRNYFYPSNVAPLWVGLGKGIPDSRGKKVIEYLKKNKIVEYIGGIPTSLDQTVEQWDLPNAWPPLQIIVIQGINDVQNGDNLASRLAQQWIRSNYRGYQETGEMFEKYDAFVPGQFGGGGEYTVQAGFGWTNGVCLELLETYGSTLTT